MPILDSVWTAYPELIDKMKVMFNDNLSFKAIAERLGHGVGRNAVIGKCNRIGLKRKKPHGGNDANKLARMERKKERYRVTPVRTVVTYIEALDLTPAPDDTAIPLAQRKTIMTIGMTDCRFPVGDVGSPDFFFCGAPIVEGTPYCAHHGMRCFTRNVPRTSAPYFPTAGFRK